MNATTRPRYLASGKAVLGVCALVGVLFIASMYLGILYDRATDPPHPPGSSEAPDPAPSR